MDSLSVLQERFSEESLNIDQTDAFGMTALQNSVELRWPDAVSFLCKKGADLQRRDRHGCLPIHQAAASGLIRVARQFFSIQRRPNDPPWWMQSKFMKLLKQMQLPDKLQLSEFTETLQVLIRAGSNVSAADKDGMTPLHWASLAGNIDSVMALVNSGAKVNETDASGFTPLHIAVYFDRADVVSYLVERHAKVNAASSEGATALHMAAYSGASSCMVLLIRQGADLNAVDSYGATPIYVAASRGSLFAAKILLESGADPSLPTKRGETPLFAALRYGHFSVCNRLVARNASLVGPPPSRDRVHASILAGTVDSRRLKSLLDPNMPDSYGRTPLFLALCGHHSGIAQELVDRGASINTEWNGVSAGAIIAAFYQVEEVSWAASIGLKFTGADGHLSPLYCALGAGKEDSAEFICHSGDCINSPDSMGRTALHWAARFDNRDICDWLLLRRADSTIEDENGQTPLHIAAAYASPALIAVLLAYQRPLDKQDKYGYTPLMIAVSQHRTDNAKLLIAYKANINVSSDHGTALHLVAGFNDLDLMRQLIDEKADINSVDSKGRTPLSVAISSGLTFQVLYLISESADINARSRNGTTPLHMALFVGDLSIAVRLLQDGADPCAATDEGVTPLHLATMRGYVALAKALVEAGASPKATTKRGDSPLTISVQFGVLPLVSFFLQNGADPCATDSHGRTPLQLAAAFCQQAIPLLSACGAAQHQSCLSRSTSISLDAHAAARQRLSVQLQA